jgi:hypothetical protein
MKGRRFADIPDKQRNVRTVLRGISENVFLRLSGSGTISSRGAWLHEETAAASAQVRQFCYHRAILGIKLSHLVHVVSPIQAA